MLKCGELQQNISKTLNNLLVKLAKKMGHLKYQNNSVLANTVPPYSILNLRLPTNNILMTFPFDFE
jgi:hypothetical protein